MSANKPKHTRKSRDRKKPPKTIKAAYAFSMDRVFSQLPAFGFLNADRMAYMQDREAERRQFACAAFGIGDYLFFHPA